MCRELDVAMAYGHFDRSRFFQIYNFCAFINENYFFYAVILPFDAFLQQFIVFQYFSVIFGGFGRFEKILNSEKVDPKRRLFRHQDVIAT